MITKERKEELIKEHEYQIERYFTKNDPQAFTGVGEGQEEIEFVMGLDIFVSVRDYE